MNDKENYRAVFSQLHTSVIVDMEDIKNMKKPKFRFGARVMIAVIVVCILMAMSAAAVALNFLGLKDLVIPSKSPPVATDTTPVQDSGSEEPIPDVEHISLQGYADSNEYKAAAEWHTFQANYDTDMSLLFEVGNQPTGLDDKYTYTYGAYTQEMADKLDELSEKYNLVLHSEIIPLENQSAIMEKAANGNFIGDTNTAYGGYMYPDGTFQFDGGMVDNETAYADVFEGFIAQYDPEITSPEEIYYLHNYNDETPVIFVPYDGTNEDAVVPAIDSITGEVSFVPYEGNFDVSTINEHNVSSDPVVGFQFRYCVKGYFDSVYLNIGNISDYAEWEYKTACGITVHLSQNTFKSLIILDLDNAFVTVNILEGNNGFSATELEAFADTIDFTLLK